MVSRKKGLGQQFDNLLQTQAIPLSFNKLIGSPVSNQSPQGLSITLDSNVSLEVLAQSLAGTETVNDFITKYGSTYYNTLDELLEASKSQHLFQQSFVSDKPKDTNNLFEGLGELLDI